MVCYSAVQRDKPLIHATWMILQIIMLCEKSQTFPQNSTLFHLYEIFKNEN